MSKKQYTVTTIERAAQPRSKRRQGGSSSTGGGGVVVGGQSEGSAAENAELAAQAHSHANKPLLDSLSDADGYLLMQQKAENADDSERGKVKAGYADEAGVAEEARGLSEDSELWDKFLRKDEEDTAQERIHFEKGLDSGDYEAGGTGFGLTKDIDNNWLLEVDRLHVRQKLSAVELEIQKMSHVGGVIVASAASIVVSRVEPGDGVLVEGVSVVPWYKCFFNQEDSAGNQVVRTFQVGDLARCQTFHYKQSKNTQNKYYWRKVVAVGDDWVSLGNLPGEYASDSDWPEAGDHVVLLGNVSDSSRQNAIVIAGAGTGNPYIRVYTGINSFTLPNAEVQLSPHGSWITVTDRNGNRVRLDDLVSSLEGMITSAQDQADQMIEIWFGDVAPTASNAPALDWTDAETKALHEGDLYYNRGALSAGGGRAFVWHQIEEVWGWSELTDRDVLASLEAAARAQDTADGKRRVFVGQPTAPYDEGDLWVNATYPAITDNGNGNASVTWYDVVTGKTYGNGDIFNNDIVRCKTARASGSSFSVWDWEPVQEMTTSKILQTAAQIILSVTNLATGLETAGVHIDGEDSEVRIIAEKTKFINPNGVQVASFTEEGLQSNKVQCLDGNGNKRLEVDANGVRMYYPLQAGQASPQVMKEEIFIYDSSGNVIGTETRYYNMNGTIKWRLDSAGTLATAQLQEYWTTSAAYKVTEERMQQIFQAAKNHHGLSYDFTETTGRVVTGSVSRFTSIQGSHSEYNGMTADGVIENSTAPSGSTTWVTGWLMIPLTAIYEGKENDSKEGIYSRRFVYYNNGVPSSCLLTYNGTTEIVGELIYEFNRDTESITDVIYQATTPIRD